MSGDRYEQQTIIEYQSFLDDILEAVIHYDLELKLATYLMFSEPRNPESTNPELIYALPTQDQISSNKKQI